MSPERRGEKSLAIWLASVHCSSQSAFAIGRRRLRDWWRSRLRQSAVTQSAPSHICPHQGPLCDLCTISRIGGSHTVRSRKYGNETPISNSTGAIANRSFGWACASGRRFHPLRRQSSRVSGDCWRHSPAPPQRYQDEINRNGFCFSRDRSAGPDTKP
jgi:hypothetical protein